MALRYASRINGMTALVITKLDVLSGFDTLKVCTSYQSPDGGELATFPYHQSVLHHAKPVYEELPGWSEDVTGCRSEEELPQAARDYLKFIEDFVGVPVKLLGVGPARDQIVWIGERSVLTPA